MSKRTVFTSITPLPSTIPRDLAIEFLHNHTGMIDLSPLVTKRHPIPPPKHALPEEHACKWYAITEKISYLPGGLVSGEVDFTAAFHDLPRGLQTHCYAPMGLDLREKWTVGGTLPGEAPEVQELGLEVPPTGLYIREDVDMRCSIVMAGFVKKTLKRAHETVVETLIAKAQIRAKLRTRRDTLCADQDAEPSASPFYTRPQAQALRPPMPSDRPASWGGREQNHQLQHQHPQYQYQASGDHGSHIQSYGRQAQENAFLRSQNMYPHPLTKPLY